MNFEDKYYRVYAGIDLDAVYKNVENLISVLEPESGLTAVVKADGYGHGAIPVAKKIENIVESFGVATIDEALNLIKHGIKKPIHIIGFTHESRILKAVENNIRLTVYDFEQARQISNITTDEKPAYIHIKIDTGMSRIGFKDNEQSIETILEINELPNLIIEGVFSHFSSSDASDKTSSNKQLNRYLSFINKLEKKGMQIPIKHVSNSAATIDIKEANLSNVRAGISIYGIYPSNDVDKSNVKLYPALTLNSHIIQLKEIDEGTPVSYSETYVATKKTKVATVPVGYGDGYPRSLSNIGYVLVKGKRAPIIGRICMDQFMVDVTDIDRVENGDEVVLIGKQMGSEILVDELSELSNRFTYEFVCDLGKRIPRVYFSKGKVVCKKDYFEDEYKIID